jgi:hypothetical protein
MRIEFVSTLTPEDEEGIVTELLKAVEVERTKTGFSYAVSIETSDGKLFSQVQPPTIDERLTA